MKYLLLIACLGLSGCATAGTFLRGMGQAMTHDTSPAPRMVSCTSQVYGNTVNTQCF